MVLGTVRIIIDLFYPNLSQSRVKSVKRIRTDIAGHIFPRIRESPFSLGVNPPYSFKLSLGELEHSRSLGAYESGFASSEACTCADYYGVSTT